MTNSRIADQLDLLTQAQEIDELKVGFTVHFEVLAPADLAELEELKNAIKAPYEITRFSIYPGSYTLQITLIADIQIPSAPPQSGPKWGNYKDHPRNPSNIGQNK